MKRLSELASLLRLHIVGVAVCAALVFAWLMAGDALPWIAAVGGVDWLVINLLNRVTDVREDLANGIPATGLVARHPRSFAFGTGMLFGASLLASHLALPALTPWRLLVQLIGTAYSVPLVPTPRGLRRFKEIYFLKNFMSAVLFVLTCFVYPVVVAGPPVGLPAGFASLALLAAFFVPFELTYEILYDLRDLEGDRLAKVPTYPVAHGPERARQIIDGLLVLCALPLVAGLLTGLLGAREGLMLAAPVLQYAFYRPRYRRGLTRRDCIVVTHLGSALLLVYLVGNQIWLAAGMPTNLMLR